MIKIVRIITASLLITTPVLGKQSVSEHVSHKSLQDSRKALEHFENELAFTTNPHGVKKVVDGEEGDIIIVDVRSAKDFAEGHIPGAINIPWEQHNSFEGKEMHFEGLRKDKYAYVYCYALLCNLAQKAARKFASLGYPVKEMVGGFEAWEQEGMPIVK